MSSAYYSPLVSADLIWEVTRMYFDRPGPGLFWGGEEGIAVTVTVAVVGGLGERW